ncbi:hypothetical protein EON82_10065 [bacterium]|nr:MAG: hypothetical protein EON82_10065 [bacterium]
MRIVTLNVRNPSFDDGANAWPHRREAFFETLRRLRPDVLCLQEDIEALHSEVCRECGFTWFMGEPREDESPSTEYGSMFFRESIAGLASGTEWLSETPQLEGSKGWGAACPRTMHWIDFENWTLINTHLDHVSLHARTNGMRQIIALADSIGKPCLITGDLNAEPDEPALALAREAGFVDFSEGTGPTYHGFRKPSSVTEPLTTVLERVDKIKRLVEIEQDPIRRAELLRSHAEIKNRAFEYEKLAFPESSKIDYILARGPWRCERAWVERGDYSDHWAVVADVEFTDSSR